MFNKPVLFVAGLLCSTPLLAQGYWQEASAGYVPPGAYISSHTQSGKPMYLCRATYQDIFYNGSFVPGQNGCTVTVNGTNRALGNYEIYVSDYADNSVAVDDPYSNPFPYPFPAYGTRYGYYQNGHVGTTTSTNNISGVTVAPYNYHTGDNYRSDQSVPPHGKALK